MIEFSEDNYSFKIAIPRLMLTDNIHNVPKVIMEPLANVTCLVWPRIPKTGGENLLLLLKNLIPKNKVIITHAGSAYNEDKYNHSIIPNERFNLELIEYDELIEYFQRIIHHHFGKNNGEDGDNFNKLLILQYHAPFVNNVDFNKLLSLKPYQIQKQWKYITLIRDPISRIISSYYYLRGESGGWRGQNGSDYNKYYVPKIFELQKNYDIDQCINDYMNGNNICQFSTNYYIKWFCGGNAKLCDPLKINQDSYERAIDNIDKYFAWIGVMEYYDKTVYSLYDRFPTFFYKDRKRFAQKLKYLDKKLKQLRDDYGYGHYQKPNSQSMKILKQKNHLDLQLYQYVVQKFQYQSNP